MTSAVRKLSKQPASIESKVCLKAQHNEMLDQVLRLFDIHPDFDLNVMQPDQTLAQVTANVLT